MDKDPSLPRTWWAFWRWALVIPALYAVFITLDARGYVEAGSSALFDQDTATRIATAARVLAPLTLFCAAMWFVQRKVLALVSKIDELHADPVVRLQCLRKVLGTPMRN